ncbi:MAG: gliding motility-associated C-terminal domain-containing protein [Bacteroidota bacterium]|nr:gliding motility-associated C-terminal domain-containing protein [Bacteroidota bacterium]
MNKTATTRSLPLLVIFIILAFLTAPGRLAAQRGNEFWLAPPDITDLHNTPGGEPLYVIVSSAGAASTVTIDQPANGAFVPIVVTVQANKSRRINLTAFKTSLETRPTNTIVNTGLHITSTTPITAYYECANTNNTDIWALKGPNALGREFYIPMHKHAPFFNEASFAAPHQAFASFDICATQNATQVTIYTPVAVDGHAALTQFTITLNRGQTYSCGWTGANWQQPSTHPSGAVVLSDKDVVVSLKDDSDHNPSGGCYDIMGDQLVPVSVVGTDYIAVKGSLNNTGDESVILMATQNNTQVFLDGAATPVATLFAGEYYRVDIDYLSASINNAVYIRCTKPAYAIHVTGFGCEMGQALLPPLNCAGSTQLNFVRDDAQTFYITLLCRAAAINAFTITGPGTATIPPASFVTVPGTAGVWMAARIQYNTTQVPVDSTFIVTNSVDVFALGVVNGGASSGCKYGYFSEFVAPIAVNAGIDRTICANTTVTLAGAVSGGTTTGQWASNGTGTFTPNNTTLNAVYTPSAGDAALGSVILTLTSTGACNPVSDPMTLTITPAPTANAGADQTKCRNNANTSLSGSVTVATGGVWTGGAGTFTPSNNVLNPVYTPTAGELTAGSVLLVLTTTGNGICNPVSDNVLITFTPSPIVNAGSDQTKCGNNAVTTLAGSVTIATGGVWTGGGGSFAPNSTALNASYTPSAAEITAGNVTLTLTSTGNGTCNQVTDQVTIFFTSSPTANAGPDQTKCANNAATTLAGGITIATGGQWTGGLGTFAPTSATLNATYTPTAAEIAGGSLTLTLSTTGNGTCNAATDQVTIFFTPAPTVNAGPNQTVCSNNSVATLSGSFTTSTGAAWTGGAGTFSPNNTTMNATYAPTAAERTAGTVTLTLTTTGNGTCTAVSDQMVITITPSPTANAGPDQTKCGNNAATTLAGGVIVATGGQWTGGAGSFSPNNSALNAVYTPTAGEISSGNVTLTLTTTGNGSCNPVTDQVTIFFSSSPTANAGADQTKCANNATTTLAGSVTIASGGQWTGGLGTFTPNNNTLSATYTPTASEISGGSITLTLTTTGNGTCTAVTDQMTIFFTPAPTVNAGPDQTICSNNSVVTLSGSFTTAGGAAWSGGAGTFTPNNTTMSATYTPTAAERAAGTLTLTLTTTGNGTCTAVTDQMVITITPSPTANAGPDQTKCGNNPNTTLAGSVTVASGGVWSGGAGTFTPSTAALNAVYTPTAGEIAGGSVTLTLTTTGNGTCVAVTDQVTIFFSAPPTANAGADQTKCANNAITTLAGSVTVATGGQWTGGLGTFTPNNNALSATYAPTAAEVAGGSITLTLTTTGNGTCVAVTDQMTIFFTPAPTVNAGPGIIVCANNATATLNGAFTTASGAAWTGGAGTFSPNNTTMNATYTPTAAEITAGTVTLTLTSTGNGTCTAVSDQVVITITTAPTVNAGLNISSCANNAAVSLNGQVFNAGGGVWSGGGGTFFPNNTTLNATYTANAAEISAGTVTLTLTSSGNGSCSAVTDQVVISYAPSPIANAGADQSVCGNNSTVSLNGFVNFCAGGQWTGGLGLFSPSANALNATYTPTAGEVAAGFVTLTLTTTGNGACLPVTDQMTIIYTASPTVDAGLAQTACANNSSVVLNGSFTVASGGIWSGGLGSFTPNNTIMGATYTPSAAEITAGTVMLYLTTTGNGTCLAVTDSMLITITTAPVVNAGADETTCVNNLNIALSGSVSGPTNTGAWTTSGTGTFVPNNTNLNATYQASSADSAAGGVTITLTSTGNGACTAATDQLSIFILPAGTSNAGNNVTVCGNNASVTLNGIVGGGATGGTWGTTGSGIFLPNNSTLNATYVPSQIDIANGSVTIYLTANSCNPAVDSLTITITPAPVSDAGLDQTICASVTTVTLAGNVSGGSTTGIWTTSGSGSFTPNNTTMNATYNPSASDIATQNIMLFLTSTNNGSCVAVTDTMLLNIYPTGTANAGSDQIICSNNPNVILSGTLGGGATQGQWSTTGSGVFSPNDTALNATYIPSPADLISGTVSIVLTATNSCNNAIDFMNVIFTPAPVVDAGTSQSTCGANPAIILNGNVTNATGGVWSGGGGTYAPNNTNMNATYTPSAAEQSAGFVILTLTSTGNGNCNPVSDTVSYNFSPGIVVSAGPDQSVCISATYTQMQGIVANGSTTGMWSTLGSGTFNPNDSALNALYTFSTADTTAGSITLILTSTNNGVCPVARDTMVITFGPSAYAFAGYDQSVCSNTPDVVLGGFVSGGATQGVWVTSGTGTFAPNDSTLNATYTFSAGDVSAGMVTFILSTTDHGSCFPGIDTVVFIIAPTSVVSAGGNVTICSDNLSVPLGGNVSGASTTGTWSSTGSGTFSPDNQTLNGTYIPSASDSFAGTVTLILTSTNTGSCAPANDSMVVTITEPAIVNAGVDQTTCSQGASVVMNGNISGGTTTGIWSTLGTGTFTPANTAMNATYTPSPADLVAGTISIVLTSTGNGICTARTDTMVITIIPMPIVSAGPDRVVCGDQTDVLLNGTVTGSTTTGLWTTTGSGSFSPNATTLSATYQMSNADVIAGTVTLILTTTNNTLCPAISDTVIITVEPLPIAAFSFATGDSLNIIFTDQSVGAVQWYWSYGDGGTSTQQDTTHTYANEGTYPVTLIITSAGGCTDTITTDVNPEETLTTPVAIPTGFSPNGDGTNDVLHVLGGPFKEVDFSIYNEWGNLIYHTNDPNGGWDGTYKGMLQPGGVYIYTATGTTIADRFVKLSGNVTLIR